MKAIFILEDTDFQHSFESYLIPQRELPFYYKGSFWSIKKTIDLEEIQTVLFFCLPYIEKK
jgi:hypothetical protein